MRRTSRETGGERCSSPLSRSAPARLRVVCVVFEGLGFRSAWWLLPKWPLDGVVGGFSLSGSPAECRLSRLHVRSAGLLHAGRVTPPPAPQKRLPVRHATIPLARRNLAPRRAPTTDRTIPGKGRVTTPQTTTCSVVRRKVNAKALPPDTRLAFTRRSRNVSCNQDRHRATVLARTACWASNAGRNILHQRHPYVEGVIKSAGRQFVLANCPRLQLCGGVSRRRP